MSKYEFMKMVESAIRNKNETIGCQVSGHTYIRNNDVVRYGISIRQGKEKLSPTFYVDSYYEAYQRKKITVDEAAGEIVKQLGVLEKREFNCDFHAGIDMFAGSITYRLISATKNKKLLAETPYIPFLDMAMIFTIVFGNSSAGVETLRINRNLKESWDISTEELYSLAKKNTPRIFPYKLESLTTVMEECFGELDIREYIGEPQMYILTNELGVYGASSILYPGMTDKITALLGGDFYVIPSSVHEVLVVPAEGVPEIENLDETIQLINKEHVLDEEVLSDRAYYYDSSKKRFKI